MATIKLLIQSEKQLANIYVRLREGRAIDIKVKTNFVINGTDWNNSKGKPKNIKSADMKALNLKLETFKANLLVYYNESVNRVSIDKNWMKEFINPTKTESKIPNYLVEYFEYYSNTRIMSDSSIKKLSVVNNFIIKFEEYSQKRFLVSDINELFMKEFLDFSLKNGYKQNYASKNFNFIKTVCFHASRNNIKIDKYLSELRIKNKPTPTVYLTEDEINKVKNVHLNDELLDNVRDWLIISCVTAQRISDFLSFTKEMIREEKNHDGKYVTLLEFEQKKTKKLMTIPLHKDLKLILKKRQGYFPDKISSQKFNEKVKVVAAKAGLDNIEYGSLQNPLTKRAEYGNYPKWKLVSGHIGRRSFATNNFGKIPTPLIMSLTGHTTEAEFLKYIGKTDTHKALHLADYMEN